MARDWREAREDAEKKGCTLVYHDLDTGAFGACGPEERQGHFEKGRFVEHRCICMPARFWPGELEAKEQRFLDEHPEWGGTE